MITKETMMKMIFSQALESLLAEKELEEIYTAEIIKRSGLSKASFYRYFQDKYALANWTLQRVLDNQAIQLSGPEEQDRNLKDLFQTMNDNRVIYQKLFRYSGQNSISEYYMDFALKLAEKACKDRGSRITKQEKYTVRYHTSGILDLITQWLFDPNPMSAEELAKVIKENRSDAAKRIFTVRSPDA